MFLVIFFGFLGLIAKDGIQKPIHEAALKGDLVKVKKLLQSNPNQLNDKGRANKAPLHWAAQGGNLDVVKYLIKLGAKVDNPNIVGETPLVYAAEGGHLKVAKLLIKKGANVNHVTARGNKVIMYAVWSEKMDMIDYLLSKGASLMEKQENGWTILHDAAFGQNVRLVKLLLSKGVKANSKTKEGRTPLHNACAEGNLKIASILVKHGADVNAVVDDGRTPVFFASREGHSKILELLFGAGAKVKGCRKLDQKTPLHMACLNGHKEVSEMLVKHGAKLDALDKTGKSPIYYAAKYGHKTIAHMLKKSGAKIEKLDKNFGFSLMLKKDLAKGQALVWYLGHSGYAVKTQNHLLVFDYWKRSNPPAEPLLANGHINPEELQGQNVTVFVSHSHQDHYFPGIFKWKDQLPGIQYIMGFEPKGEDLPKGIHCMKPRQKKKINNLKVLTIESNDSGVGYFVMADGVKIFHSGDHANRKRDFSGPFKKEIDFLAEHDLKPNLFFAPVSGCGFGDLVAVKKGVHYTIKKLSPDTVFPVHALGGEHRYYSFANDAVKAGCKTTFCCAEHSGDMFIYNKGKSKTLYTSNAHCIVTPKCKKSIKTAQKTNKPCKKKS